MMISKQRSGWVLPVVGMCAFVAMGCSSNTSNNSTGGVVDIQSSEPVPDGSAPLETNGDKPAPLPTGPKAPDFTLKTLDGDEITLSDYEGKKVVLVDFWATHCDPCIAEMPELVKLYNDKKDQGLEILAVTIDGPQTIGKVSAVVKKTKMNFPILLDEDTEAMDRFNPKGELPFTCVVSRSGHIVLKRAGYQAGDEESWHKLVEAVDGALAQK